MKCPHCTVAFSSNYHYELIDRPGDFTGWWTRTARCPECDELVIEVAQAAERGHLPIAQWFMVRPRGANRGPVPSSVPAPIAEDYIEACNVLPISPKASAALSRRCLQNILRSHGYKAKQLWQEIDLILAETDTTKAMRLPPIHPSALDPVQQDLYDDMRAGIAAGFNGFRTALDDGSMIGPWNASLHHPAVGKASWQLTKAVNAIATLPVNVKEVAILVVGGFHKASYEIYAHVAVAERMGMPLAKISALVANVKPADLTHDEATAFDVAYQLCRGGALPDAT
jgi:4-carboxymuconolactone decarboxylase